MWRKELTPCKPNNQILDLAKLKAFAVDKVYMAYTLKLVLRREENLVEKGENAGCQIFLLLP